jgi:hypothetical protein
VGHAAYGFCSYYLLKTMIPDSHDSPCAFSDRWGQTLLGAPLGLHPESDNSSDNQLFSAHRRISLSSIHLISLAAILCCPSHPAAAQFDRDKPFLSILRARRHRALKVAGQIKSKSHCGTKKSAQLVEKATS